MVGNIGRLARPDNTEEGEERRLALRPVETKSTDCHSDCGALVGHNIFHISVSSLTLDQAVTTQCWAKLPRTGLDCTGLRWTVQHCSVHWD